MSSSEDIKLNSEQFLHGIKGLDIESVAARISGITESFIGFTQRETEGVLAPNSQIPIYASLGFSALNLIPFSLGMANADKEFLSVVREEIKSAMLSDFDLCFQMGLDAAKEQVDD